MNTLEKLITDYVAEKPSFTIDELRAIVAKEKLDIPDATISWRLYEMTRKGFLQRIGRGRYSKAGKGVFS